MTNDELLRARLKPTLDRIIDATELALRLQKAWVGWATLEIAKKLNKGKYGKKAPKGGKKWQRANTN